MVVDDEGELVLITTLIEGNHLEHSNKKIPKGICVTNTTDTHVPAWYEPVVHHYDLWRRISKCAGMEPDDEADWENGRLYFRSDSAKQMKEWPTAKEYGDWAAWIIEPTQAGQYIVIRSLMRERASQRSERIEAIFSQGLDPGKYIVAHIGDSLRCALKLESLLKRWDASGPDPRIQVGPAEQRVIDYVLQIRPGTSAELPKSTSSDTVLLSDPRNLCLCISR